MNKDEAVEALSTLEHISVARLEPNDVIVAECDGGLTKESREKIASQLKELWPNHKVVICNDSVRLKVLRA